jgi:hypothetical protein
MNGHMDHTESTHDPSHDHMGGHMITTCMWMSNMDGPHDHCRVDKNGAGRCDVTKCTSPTQQLHTWHFPLAKSCTTCLYIWLHIQSLSFQGQKNFYVLSSVCWPHLMQGIYQQKLEHDCLVENWPAYYYNCSVKLGVMPTVCRKYWQGPLPPVQCTPWHTNSLPSTRLLLMTETVI